MTIDENILLSQFASQLTFMNINFRANKRISSIRIKSYKIFHDIFKVTREKIILIYLYQRGVLWNTNEMGIVNPAKLVVLQNTHIRLSLNDRFDLLARYSR